MSLVGHWKLDGDDTDSLGQYDGYEQGGPSYSAGKIGDCYDNTSGSGTGVEVIRHDDMVEYEKYYSISLWFKSTTTTGNGNVRILSRDASEYVALCIDQNEASPQTMRVYNGANPPKVAVNEWHNIIITIDVGNNQSQTFLNGELVSTGGTSQTSAARPFVIGGNTEGDGDITGNHFQGKIDDVRLYDHILSEKEARGISQAKVLHYKFDNFAEPTKNRSEGAGDHDWRGNNGSNTISETDSNAPHRSVVRLEKDGSADQWHGQHGRTDTYPLSVGDNVTFSGWYRLESGASRTHLSAANYEADGWSSHGGAGYTMENDGQWHRFEMTSEISGDSPSGEYQPAMSWGYNTNAQWLELCGVQIETKDHATPFVNGERDEWVTDTSGYDNHGEFGSNSPEWVESTKVGSGAYEFDGSDDNIDLPSQAIPTGNEVTVSFWSYGGVDQPTSDSILEAEDSGNNRVLNIHHPWDNGNIYWDTDDGGSGYDRIYKSANSSDYKGRWAHWTFTKDANTGDQKIYLDGELWHSGTGKTGSLATTDVASLGSYADGNSKYWQGKVDDFRIYATPLSASEVKEIYEQRGSIDSAGSFHSHELLDTPSSEQTADESEWTLGTSGSQGSFSRNGGTSENDIIEYADPFGKMVPTWRCSPDSTSGGDGGWNMTFQGDNSDRLRYSVFVKRTGNSMNGSYYHGCHNSGNTLNLDGSTNGNPYFHSGNLPSLNDWYLLVGILHPNSYTGSNTGVSGVYDLNGNKVSGGSEYKWGTGSTQEMRDYLYYSTDTSERQYFVYPRVDVVDGSEPDISSLVNGLDSRTNNQRDMNLTREGTLEAGLNEVGPAAGSLVGWWPLDGDTRDYAGSANGTNNGSSVTSGLGQSAYDFDGNGDGIDVGARNFSSSSWTLTMWINPDEVSKLQHLTGVYGSDFGDWSPLSHFAINNSKVTWWDPDSGWKYGNTTLSNENWYFISLVGNTDAESVITYVDGEQDKKVTSTIKNNIGVLDVLGYRGHSNDRYSNGKFQDVRVYDRALTPEEVTQLYNLTDPRKDQRVIQSPDGAVYTKGKFDETL